MKFKLINMPSFKYTTQEQLLINRGIKEENLKHYVNLTDKDINPPTAFGEALMSAAGHCFLSELENDEDICIIIDVDCDGYTSSALLINYIYDLKGREYIDNHVHWIHHEGKQHGLNDCMDWIISCNPSLVIVPDAGSNDIKSLEELYSKGKKVIVLDHHDVEQEQLDWWQENTGHLNTGMFLINSQLGYPNKDLSGVGVVWQFCRYVDTLKGTDYADQYLDLVATGNIGDMMSLTSFETRRLAFKGLEPSRIINPFLYGMWQKNIFKLTEKPTAWGFTFYVVPLINAITRSGTMEEKYLIFEAMLKFKAHEQILSNKRGHKLGETEELVTQAVRTAGNVKRHQSDAESEGMALIEHLIQENNMLEHKVLLFLLEPNSIKSTLRGLVGNKIMAKYQRPCCVLTKTEHKDGRITYEGSARGCDRVGVTQFKDICANTSVVEYVAGHQGAFGLGISSENLEDFLKATDFSLKDMPAEPIYYVDYLWKPSEVDGQIIMDVANFGPYIGKDLEEPLVAIQGLQITKEMLTLMGKGTLKITLPNGISIIKFGAEEDYNNLYSENGSVEINLVCKCNINCWNGNVSPQLILENYEIMKKCAYVF